MVTAIERRQALAETCLSLADLADSLSTEQWALPTGCPGWDVHDQVAHVSSLEAVISGVPEPDHTAPAAPHVRNSIGAWMENLVDRRRSWSPAELIAELRAAVVRRQEMLAAFDDDPAAMVPGLTGKPMPAQAALGIRVFDCLAHEQDVRRAVDRPGGLDGLAAATVLERLPAMLTESWSEELPDAAVALLVDGVTLVAPPATGPVVTLTCSTAGLIAASTGRTDGSEVRIEAGDPELGGQLIAAMVLTP